MAWMQSHPLPSAPAPDGVDALVADPAALHERLLHEAPAVPLRVNLVRPPHRDLLAVAQDHAERLVQFQVAARLRCELPRVDLQARRHPADGVDLGHLQGAQPGASTVLTTVAQVCVYRGTRSGVSDPNTRM